MTTYRQESRPMIYRTIRGIGRAALSIFFREIELRHGERVPRTGPVVFVANHPNSIMDAFVIGVAIPRKVNYIGHSGLFRNVLADRFLRSCGVIPIIRQGELSDKFQDNTASFEACFQTLEKGETIGIFPEGTSDMLRTVKKLKTGAARIILEAERRNGYSLGVHVIPLGLYFFSRSRFRSRILINVGEPIDMAAFFKLNETDNPAAVLSLTSRIQENLSQLTIHLQHVELDDLVRDVEVIYKDELVQNLPRPAQPVSPNVEKFFATQKIAAAVEYFNERAPDRVKAFRDRVDAYNRKLRALHIHDGMLQENLRLADAFRRSLGRMLLALPGLPFALYGMINNFIPHQIAIYWAKKFLHERTKILTALLFAGGPAFIGFYGIQMYTVYYFFGLWPSIAYFVSLPVTGLFALAYIKELRAERDLIMLGVLLLTHRSVLHRMRRERRLLIEDMNRYRDEFLKSTAQA